MLERAGCCSAAHSGHATRAAQDPAEVDPKAFKLIWTQLQNIADEAQSEPDLEPLLKTLAVEEVNVDHVAMVRTVGVLIDGGASHNVYYSATIPKGAVEREVELAHGSKKGYIVNDDIIFLDDTMSAEQGAVPSIISMGR